MNEVVEQRKSVSLPVDAEHSGLRVAVFGLFIAGWVIGYLIVSLILPGAGLNLLALGGGFVIGYAVSWITERFLRTRWPSGRKVELDARGVRLIRKGALEREIKADSGAPINLLRWRFQTPRRSRVPKGWHVLACALEQDENLLCAYTFMSPAQFKDFAAGEAFTALKSRKQDKKDKKGGRDDLMMAGEQRRLYQAENQRWLDGAEMSAADFQTYLDTLKLNYSEWLH